MYYAESPQRWNLERTAQRRLLPPALPVSNQIHHPRDYGCDHHHSGYQLHDYALHNCGYGHDRRLGCGPCCDYSRYCFGQNSSVWS